MLTSGTLGHPNYCFLGLLRQCALTLLPARLCFETWTVERVDFLFAISITSFYPDLPLNGIGGFVYAKSACIDSTFLSAVSQFELSASCQTRSDVLK